MNENRREYLLLKLDDILTSTVNPDHKEYNPELYETFNAQRPADEIAETLDMLIEPLMSASKVEPEVLDIALLDDPTEYCNVWSMIVRFDKPHMMTDKQYSDALQDAYSDHNGQYVILNRIYSNDITVIKYLITLVTYY